MLCALFDKRIDGQTLQINVHGCPCTMMMIIVSFFTHDNNINSHFILLIVACRFAGNGRSVRRHISWHHHRTRLLGPLRAWYIGHVGGHRVARNGRWWVVTKRTKATHRSASYSQHAYARLVLVSALRSIQFFFNSVFFVFNRPNIIINNIIYKIKLYV